MGILAAVRNSVVKGTKKAADGVAKTSQLSPEQVRTIDDKRIKYLSEKPSRDDEMVEELTKRNLGAIGIEVYNAYLPQISELYLPIKERKNFEGNNRISYFEICKWVKDPTEDNIEKLMSVYQVLSEEKCNIALIYNRTIKGCAIYLAVVNNGSESDPSEVKSFKDRILGALKGNFPGAGLVTEKRETKGFGINVPDCLTINSENNQAKAKSVAVATNLATEKSEKFISQTIEKVLDGIIPQKKSEEYTIVLLATPVKEQIERKNRLYELYTALAPYSDWQTNYTFTEMHGVNSSSTFGLNIGTNAGTQSGISRSEGESNSTTESESTTNTVSIGVNAGVSAGGSHSKTKGIAKTVTKVITDAVNTGTNLGFNMGASFARSSSVTANLGKNEGITQNFVNYGIKHTLENLERQVQRLEESTALGLWDFAAYVISEDSIIANNVAHTYLALTQGEDSFLAEASVNLWRGDLRKEIDINNEKEQAESILISLSRLQHPEFCLRAIGKNAIPDEYLVYPSSVTATTSLSGKELARALNFPSKSVCGLPVIETAAFGRNVSSYSQIDKDFILGDVYHMHTSEPDSKVELSKLNMTSHIFVTGSTGTGKTNTVAKVLKRIVLDNDDDKTHFMVIEPAKGEYKDIIGGYENVKVYGTNPNYSLLLRINPFSFPRNITVGEHIDRLVEIFNVCWPMYAAMPAILKDAIIRAYEEAGWDIETSKNTCSEKLFPGFIDVMEQVKWILNSSEYSADTKGDYTGALIARLKTLTNGINAQIFSVNCLSDDELFDKNVVIDMSRVGSVETKSLIMGLLVLKLQEYRLSEKKPDIKKLEHITVLEEAHNLLRRTSIEQSSESANLLGKSVEMLSNSIAELRAFGEGFIIADQAPGLMDMAVIRNTNTKIVHRLPEQSDRELVGRSMGLSDGQIAELSKLEKGVAAVYQNEWIECVLCKVDEFKKKDKKSFVLEKDIDTLSEKQIHKELTDYIIKKELERAGSKVDLQRLSKLVLNSQLKVSVKKDLVEYLDSNGVNAVEPLRKVELLRKLVFDLLDAENAIKEANKEEKIEDWVNKLVEKVNPSLRQYSKKQIDLAVVLVVYELYERERDNSYRTIFQTYKKMFDDEKGVR